MMNCKIVKGIKVITGNDCSCVCKLCKVFNAGYIFDYKLLCFNKLVYKTDCFVCNNSCEDFVDKLFVKIINLVCSQRNCRRIIFYIL